VNCHARECVAQAGKIGIAEIESFDVIPEAGVQFHV